MHLGKKQFKQLLSIVFLAVLNTLTVLLISPYASWLSPTVLKLPPIYSWHLPLYWTFPTYIMIAPTVLWIAPTVINIPYCMHSRLPLIVLRMTAHNSNSAKHFRLREEYLISNNNRKWKKLVNIWFCTSEGNIKNIKPVSQLQPLSHKEGKHITHVPTASLPSFYTATMVARNIFRLVQFQTICTLRSWRTFQD